jgi:VWFA-related protein
MAIFALGSKLHFVQGFTTDPAILADALKDPKRGAGQETSDIVISKSEQATSRTVIDNLIELGNESRSAYFDQQMATQLKQFMGEQTASITDLRVNLTLEAFQQLAHYLSGIPGRKNVVWFSSSFPLTLFANQDLTDPSASQREFTDRVRKTARLLAAANVAVYPVAAAGLETDSLYDVNQKMVIPGEAQQKTQLQLQQSDSVQRVQNQSSMEELARDTGGQAYFNTNGLADALTRISDAGANYYTISYVPPNDASDGAFHKIQVKLPGNYKLSYRRGYFANDPVAEAAEEAKSRRDPLSTFMGPGLPDSTDVALAVRVVPAPDPSAAQSDAPSSPSSGVVANPAEPQPAKLVPAGDNPRLGGNLKRYSVDFLLTAHGIQLQPTPDGGRQGKAEIAIIAYDHAGRALNWIERAYQLRMNAEQFSEVEKRGLKFHLVLDIPKDGVSLRTGVCDLSSHRVATLEVPLASVINPEALADTAAK